MNDTPMFPEFDAESEPRAYAQDRQREVMNQPYEGLGIMGEGVKDFITIFRRGAMDDWPRYWKELFTQLHSDVSLKFY